MNPSVVQAGKKKLGLINLVNVSGLLAGAILFGLVFFTCFEVVMRYWLKQGLESYIEIAGYIALGGTFLGTAYTYTEGRHIAVDFVLLRLNSRVRRRITALNHLIVAVFSLVISWMAFKTSIDSYYIGKTSATHMRIVLWPFELLIAYGWLLVGLSAFKKVKMPERTG